MTVAPDSGLGFADLQHGIQVMENTPQEAVLKTLPLARKPQRNIRIRCEVASALDLAGKRVPGLFRAELDTNKDCRLVLARSGLDHETMAGYTVGFLNFLFVSFCIFHLLAVKIVISYLITFSEYIFRIKIPLRKFIIL